ncbi:MAG: hypothetical protein ACLVJO_04155 [[Clostridium] scindens]
MAAAIMGIAVGFLVGLINAFLVIIVKIPTFWHPWNDVRHAGVTSWYNDGKALTIKAIPGFSVLGQGRIAIIPVIFLIVIAVCICAALFLQAHQNRASDVCNRRESGGSHHRGLNTKKYLLCHTAVRADTWFYRGSSMLLQLWRVAITGGWISWLGAVGGALEYIFKTGVSVIGTVISGMFIAALSNALIINGISTSGYRGTWIILILSILLTVIKNAKLDE